jgi:hypothetical protein
MKLTKAIFWASVVCIGLNAEARAQCPGDLDNDDQVSVDELLTAVQSTLNGCPQPRFVDNGDGTVSDRKTGLMWEKKTVDDGLHGQRAYTWSASGARPDGTAFTEFLPALNDCVGDEQTGVEGGFAGHCDWRLPTVEEVLAIWRPTPPGSCLDPIFGEQVCMDVWTSSGDSFDASRAWTVEIDDDGFAETKEKIFGYRVRAVRTDRRAPSGTR